MFFKILKSRKQKTLKLLKTHNINKITYFKSSAHIFYYNNYHLITKAAKVTYDGYYEN